MPLSPKQALFVEAFAGDPGEAALIAGYKGTLATLRLKGEQLLRDPAIQEAIKLRVALEQKTKQVIATRQERQALWTSIMKNEDPYAKPEVKDGVTIPPSGNIPIQVRLKASELLGKSEADFIDRVEHSGDLTFTQMVEQSYDVDDNVILAVATQIEAKRSKLDPPHEPKPITYVPPSTDEEPDPIEDTPYTESAPTPSTMPITFNIEDLV